MRSPNEILNDPLSPLLDEIEIAEAVLGWCATAKFMAFDHNGLSEILARTTNILRWNQDYPIRTLKKSEDA